MLLLHAHVTSPPMRCYFPSLASRNSFRLITQPHMPHATRMSLVCHMSHRCFRYGFTEVPGGAAWANKSVLSWHNSVLGKITPDDTCALH